MTGFALAFQGVFIVAALAIVIQLWLGVAPAVILIRVSVLVAGVSLVLAAAAAVIGKYLQPEPGGEKIAPPKTAR